MNECERFQIIFAVQAKDHLRNIERKYHTLIRNAIVEQLTFEPHTETRNRKPLRPPMPFASTWEIRLGPNNRFRVFYDVNAELCTVEVLAIGEKEGNRLKVGGEVVDGSGEN